MRFRVLLLSVFFVVNAAYAADIPVSRGQMVLSYAPVVKQVVPAVVNIFTKHTERMQQSPLFNDPFFHQFFGDQGMMGAPRERVVQSLGSGVIVGEDGTIVTSYHVVKGSDEIKIALYDKREFEGHVEKIDERADLAVLKVDTQGQKLPALSLRDSDTLEVGDLVLAVGNPFGVGQTVTSGIISALARSASGVSDYQFFIQTDAAINPGNSGGALVDMQGRLIGINTAIYTRSGGYQGIGFAIPSNMVNAVLKGRASKSGALIRPWFGVSVQPVTREIADAQGLNGIRGVLVERVAPGSPAEKAGIRAGDILTQLGGGEVNDAQGINFRIAVIGIGHESTASLWRGGKEITVKVTLVETPADDTSAQVTLHGHHALDNVTVAKLTPDIAEELHLKPDLRGVVVLRSGNGGIFGMSVVPGDVIVGINGVEVGNVAQLQAQLAAHLRRLQITLVRQGAVFTLTVVQ